MTPYNHRLLLQSNRGVIDKKSKNFHTYKTTHLFLCFSWSTNVACTRCCRWTRSSWSRSTRKPITKSLLITWSTEMWKKSTRCVPKDWTQTFIARTVGVRIMINKTFFVIIFPFLRVSSVFDSFHGCLTNWGRLPRSSEGFEVVVRIIINKTNCQTNVQDPITE